MWPIKMKKKVEGWGKGGDEGIKGGERWRKAVKSRTKRREEGEEKGGMWMERGRGG